jgi:hypothetical protein
MAKVYNHPLYTTSSRRFPHDHNRVPHELKQADQWLCCDEKKAPLVPMRRGTFYAAKSTDPTTWRSYEHTYEAWLKNPSSYVGIGRVFVETEDYVGVDLDGAYDAATRMLTPWAHEIVERLDTYCEISPSLTGIKLWGKAASIDRAYVKPGLEIYSSRRYFVSTGLAGSRREIKDCEEALEAIISEEFPRVSRDRTPYDGSCADRTVDLLDYLQRGGVEIFVEIFVEMHDGQADRKYRIRCPWQQEHTDEDASGTYCGQYETGATFFVCWHSHCAWRKWSEFRRHVDRLIYDVPQRTTQGRVVS